MSKIDCSITENYFKEKARMVKYSDYGACTICCADCPLCSDNNGTHEICADFEKLYPDKAIQIVQKWSNDHPKMTMLDKFKEQHPKAKLTKKGIPKTTCPRCLGYTDDEHCAPSANCVDCWNKPYDEQNDD